LGVDLDGVVADFIGGFKPIVAEWLGRKITDLPDEVSYGFQEWGLDQNNRYETVHRFAVKERQLFRNLAPIPGAPAALRRLAEVSDLRIRIITHRLYISWFHKEAIEQTVEWLEKNGILYWDLCFMKEKSDVGADLYIEDSPQNIDALRAAKKHVIVFSNSTNRDKSAPRADHWVDVESLVRGELAAWRHSH
jgi:5'(3')-deoxyribonucleotidase